MVSLRATDEGLVVEVVDDGKGPADRDRATPGFGLVRMSERARAVGGYLEHAPLEGGGFRFRAVLPAIGDRV